GAEEGGVWGGVGVRGGGGGSRRAVSARAVADGGWCLHVANAADLPVPPADRSAFARLWEREAALARSVLLVELDDTSDPDVQRRVARFVDTVGAPVVVSAADPPQLRRRPA